MTMERQKILHVIIGLNVGGAERSLYRLIASHSDSSCFTHSVISLTTKGVIGLKLEEEGVEVVPMSMVGIRNAPIAFYKVYKKIRRDKPDIVQCWMYHADLIGGVAAKLTRTKLVLWGIRNSEIGAKGAFLMIGIRKLCAYLSWVVPDCIICVAQSARDVHKRVGYDGRRMKVITNGYDVNKFLFSKASRDRIRSELNIDKYTVVGSVGRYGAAKDHATFIRAAAEAVKYNNNLRFLLLGREVDSENIQLRELIKSTGKSENFILLGQCDDVAAYMSAMDLFCLHSISEGFPNVLGEAMCIGLPCITTDVGDARLLLDGNGEVVSSKDAIALCDAILKMSSLDKSSLYSIGQKGRRRIERHFSLQSTVDKFESVYRGDVGLN